MTIPVTTRPITVVLLNILDVSTEAKSQAQNAVVTLGAGPVNSDYVFWLLDRLRVLINAFNAWKTTAGLDAHATAQEPGYAGTLSADMQTTINAAQSCVDWVVTNFPKDTTAVFLLSHTLNADGTRTPRNFSAAQTTGLRTALNSLIATMA